MGCNLHLRFKSDTLTAPERTQGGVDNFCAVLCWGRKMKRWTRSPFRRQIWLILTFVDRDVCHFWNGIISNEVFCCTRAHTHTQLDSIQIKNANKTVPRYPIFGQSIANLIFCEINIGTLGEGSSWHLWTEMSTGGLWFNQWLSRLPWNSRSSPVGGEIFERPQPSLDSGWWVVKQLVFLGKHPRESEPDFWGMFGLFLRSGALDNAQRPHWTTCPPTPPLNWHCSHCWNSFGANRRLCQ